MSIDEQFVEFVVKSLVTNPDAVTIERRIDEKGVLLELTVDPEDLGRVIGKRGATAQSIRTLLRALGTKNDARYNLKIVDNGVGGHQRSQDDSSSSSNDTTSSSEDDPQSGENAPDVAAASSDDDVWTSAVSSDDSTGDEEETEKDNDRLAKTRRELEDLDDLDV